MRIEPIVAAGCLGLGLVCAQGALAEPSTYSSEVAKELRRVSPALRACYDKALRKEEQSAIPRIRFTIGEKGKVEQVNIRNAGPILTRCLRETISRLTFPPTPDKGKVEVSYPIAEDPA